MEFSKNGISILLEKEKGETDKMCIPGFSFLGRIMMSDYLILLKEEIRKEKVQDSRKYLCLCAHVTL